MAKPRKEEKLSRYSKEKRLAKLTDRDMKALNNIYNYRCLSLEQIYNLTYKYNEKTGKINDIVYCRRKINEFITLKLITEVIIYDKKLPLLYQLTMEGINVLRKRLNWPNNIYDERLNLLEKGYLIESELNVKERFMAHQYNLNKFVLDLEQIYIDKPYKYEDEKHIQSFIGIRPDGIFTTGNITFFLEMDMGTESTKKLQEKWNHYRTFLSSDEYLNRERKIIILFIVEGVVRINQRISLIKNSLFTNFMDCFNSDIDIYINTPESLLNTIQNKILKEYDDSYHILNKSFKNLLSQNIKIINNGKILVNHFQKEFSFLGRVAISGNNIDFLFENFDEEPILSIYKMMFFDKITNNFRANNDTNLTGVLICKDEDIAFRNFLVFELTDIKFTTFKRLENLSLNESIFTLDKKGNLYHFNDDFVQPILEKTLK